MLVRSIGPVGLRTTHTGSVNYVAEVPAIPAAAIAAEDANRLVRLARSGRRVRLRLVLEGRREADVESANVVAEIVGREKPHEIVLLGGHLDSWDVGTGASDDAVGCVITWEAARLMMKLGIRPRRTVRVVLWTNEENGLRGAAAYTERYAGAAADHVFALESDLGVFAPAALGFSGSMAARAVVGQIASARAAEPSGDHGWWRRSRYRSYRAGRPGSHDGVCRRRRPLLRDPPHSGRHRGPHPAGRSVKGVRGDRRHGVFGCRDTGEIAAVAAATVYG